MCAKNASFYEYSLRFMALKLRDNPLNISWIGESSVCILTVCV